MLALQSKSLAERKIMGSALCTNKRNVIQGMTVFYDFAVLSQPAFTCSKLTVETLEQVVKYIQS